VDYVGHVDDILLAYVIYQGFYFDDGDDEVDNDFLLVLASKINFKITIPFKNSCTSLL